MSELLDSYKAQMPERCLTCPVFAAFVVAAEIDETNANSLTSEMLESGTDGPSPIPAANAAWHTIYAALLDSATEGELQSTRTVAHLAEHGAVCPTPKRGGVPHEALLSRVVSWLEGNRVCQNPGLTNILARQSLVDQR